VFSQVGLGSLNAGLAAAISPGYVVKVGPGTYTENPVFVSGGVTVEATGTMAETIVKGQWTQATTDGITKKNTVIKGMTLRANGLSVINIVPGGDRVMVQDCYIGKMIPPPGVPQAPEVLAMINADSVTITGCTINTTDGAAMDTAIQVLGSGASIAGVTISNNNIVVDADAASNNDYAVDVIAAAKVMASSNTITGSSGIGFRDYSNAATTDTVKDNTMTGLSQAITYNSANTSAKLTITGNTIMDTPVAPGTTAATANATVFLGNFQNMVTIQQNTIKDNDGYAIIFGAPAAVNSTGLSFTGNILSGNAYGTKNANLTPGAVLNAILNYWGNNSGPTISDNPGGTGDPIVSTTAGGGAVEYRPWSNTATTQLAADKTVPANGTLDLSTTVGIAYQSTAAVTHVSLMKYSANPQPTNPPATALEGGYYDVYSPNATLVGPNGETTILFFNPNVTTDTKAYYYSALQQTWVKCSVQAVAGNGAYVYVTIKNTGTSPTSAELNGTVFALVQQMTIPEPPASSSLTPAIGSTGVSITPVFTWAPVTGAVRYEVTVSDEPSFAIPLISNNSDINFFSVSADEALAYDTTYYWRVRAVLADSYAAGTPATAYQVGIFTTEMAPSTETGGGEPVINVEPTKPEVNVSIPPTQITVQPAEAAAIPTYILWIIVVVGAVLIIALIVLIVRTRRA